MCFLGFLLKIQKFHMEIQNFQKFLGRPLVLVILKIVDFLEILDFHVFFGFLLKIQKFPCVFLDFC